VLFPTRRYAMSLEAREFPACRERLADFCNAMGRL
jgi:hypothetical protein